MDNNIKNNGNMSSDNDIDDILKIMHKKQQNNVPSASTNTDATVIEMDAVKKDSTPVKPEEPADNGATRINMAPVKPVPKKESTQPAPQPKPTTSKLPSGGISLDDFNETPAPSKKASNPPRSTVSGVAKSGVTKLIIYLIIVIVISVSLSNAIINVGNDVFAFNKNGLGKLIEEENVTVVIPEGADTGDVAKILHKAGVIKYPGIFNLYANFRISKRSYLTGKYLTGEQTVNHMMNYDAIINTLSDYERSVSGTVRITIPEGLTVNETLSLLEEKGVGKAKDFIEALQTFEYDYEFTKLLTKDALSEHRFNTDISYRLEGYLFPDTYDFYLNENPVSAINKLLVNFNKKFEEAFYDRCKELNMTVDEVITLASLIEKEGNNATDFYYISSVFHNRLKNSASFPFLNSDATLQYALEQRVGAYDVDTSYEHPYNSYINKGLPPGPICNPGIEAIYAALYPEKTNYYYFYTKKNGTTVYSTTYEQHQNYVNADR